MRGGERCPPPSPRHTSPAWRITRLRAGGQHLRVEGAAQVAGEGKWGRGLEIETKVSAPPPAPPQGAEKMEQACARGGSPHERRPGGGQKGFSQMNRFTNRRGEYLKNSRGGRGPGVEGRRKSPSPPPALVAGFRPRRPKNLTTTEVLPTAAPRRSPSMTG